jgi:hypothetical protein
MKGIDIQINKDLHNSFSNGYHFHKATSEIQNDTISFRGKRILTFNGEPFFEYEEVANGVLDKKKIKKELNNLFPCAKYNSKNNHITFPGIEQEFEITFTHEVEDYTDDDNVPYEESIVSFYLNKL